MVLFEILTNKESMALLLNFLTFNLKYVSEKNMGLYFHMTLRDQFGRISDKLEGCV